MANEIEVFEQSDKTIQLYERMRAAIVACEAIDEVQSVAHQAQAIAAYYKQIKDDETERKFLQIKIRAWRRIGEAFIERINLIDCVTVADQVRAVRKSFADDKTVEEMSDSRINEALRIAHLPEDFFEQNIARYRSADMMLRDYKAQQEAEYWASPEGQAQRKRDNEWFQLRDTHREAVEADQAPQRAKLEEEAAQRADQFRAEARDFADYKEVRDQAFKEVGITFDRRDRERMQETVFLLKDRVHQVLRKAAFEKQITMQEILRQGLAMWFIANGYDVLLDEMDLRPRKKR